MEIVAVYWESRIKTYGFDGLTNLALLEIIFPGNDMAAWGRRIKSLGKTGAGFHLVLARFLEDQKLALYLVFDLKWIESIKSHLNLDSNSYRLSEINFQSPVELLYFQGPHFGDRYGIAHAAFAELEKASIPLLAAGCSGSSIYLVLEEGCAEKAKARLSEAFEIPS